MCKGNRGKCWMRRGGIKVELCGIGGVNIIGWRGGNEGGCGGI